MIDINKDLIKKIIFKISLIKERPSTMLYGEKNYERYLNFFDGYIGGLSEVTNVNFHEDITYWLSKKIEQESPIFWEIQIGIILKGKSEEEKILYLLNLLDEYFKCQLSGHESD